MNKMITDLIKPAIVNCVLQIEESKGNPISVTEYYTWLSSVDTCFPLLAREYISNATKSKLSPTDVSYKVDGQTAWDYQYNLKTTVLETYKHMAKRAARAYYEA